MMDGTEDNEALPAPRPISRRVVGADNMIDCASDGDLSIPDKAIQKQAPWNGEDQGAENWNSTTVGDLSLPECSHAAASDFKHADSVASIIDSTLRGLLLEASEILFLSAHDLFT